MTLERENNAKMLKIRQGGKDGRTNAKERIYKRHRKLYPTTQQGHSVRKRHQRISLDVSAQTQPLAHTKKKEWLVWGLR